jgi:hypothetical protein
MAAPSVRPLRQLNDPGLKVHTFAKPPIPKRKHAKPSRQRR